MQYIIINLYNQIFCDAADQRGPWPSTH